MKKKLLLALIIGFVLGAAVPPAQAHYYGGCQKYTCKVHVFKPYIKSFLAPVGYCESSRYPGGYSLKAGIRTNTGNGYYGRYQFGYADWQAAGGAGRADYASWWEQAYRAVVWLHKNGRQSWPNC